MLKVYKKKTKQEDVQQWLMLEIEEKIVIKEQDIKELTNSDDWHNKLRSKALSGSDEIQKNRAPNSLSDTTILEQACNCH